MPISHITINALAFKYVVLTDWRVEHPSRPFWRLYWNAASGAAIELERQEFALDPNRLVLIAPHTPFKAILRKPVRHWFAHFTLGPPYDDLGPLVVATALPPALRKLARDQCESARQCPPLWGGLLALIGFAVADAEKQRPPRPWPDARIARVQAGVREDLSRKWSNRDLARIASYSTNAFIRRFTEVVGMPPQRWVRDQRLDRARILLEHTALSIEDIAADCGFADRFHFSRNFASALGKGPASYRRSVLPTVSNTT